MKIATVILFAKDMARMRAFYRDVIGLAEVGEGSEEHWLRFDAGGCSLALHAIPREIAASIVIEEPPRERSDTPYKVAFQTDDVDATRQRLIAQGVSMREPRRFGDMVFCDGIDPEGNVFQITNR
jgi:catechol 2,3-dioxygenase-like lactoylglutathione lyase family enzyme